MSINIDIFFWIEWVSFIVYIPILNMMFYMFVRISVCYIVSYTYRECEEPVFLCISMKWFMLSTSDWNYDVWVFYNHGKENTFCPNTAGTKKRFFFHVFLIYLQWYYDSLFLMIDTLNYIRTMEFYIRQWWTKSSNNK